MKRLLLVIALVLASAGCLNLDERLHKVALQHAEHVERLNRVTIAATSSETQILTVEGLKVDVATEAAEMAKLTDPARKP